MYAIRPRAHDGVCAARRRSRSLGVQLPRVLRHPAALAIAAAAVLATPALLFAHARLVRSSPAANDSLAVAPTSLSLWFSEKPELRFTSIQLLDAAGASTPLGQPTSIAENGVSLSITRSLGSGTYSVAWRTAASDGHATNGKFSFRVIGAQAPAPPPAPAAGVTVTPIQTPPAGSSAIREAVTPAPIRWAELLSVLLLVGAIVFALAVVPRAEWSAEQVGDASTRTQRLALAAIALFAVTTVARVAIQSQLVASADSTMSAVTTAVRDTRWGHGWATGALGAIFALIGLLAANRSRRGWFLAAFGAVLVALSESLTGHAAAVQHTALSVAADVTHVLGAGSWIGTLALMLLIGLPALRRMHPPDAPRAGSTLTRAYHTAAVDGVILVVISGTIAAVLRLPTFSALWTTDYGSWLYRKLVFVLIALAFGVYHWRRVAIPDWTSDTHRKFSRSALAEFAVGLVIVALTAMLVSTPMPS
jgi:copper transport protein